MNLTVISYDPTMKVTTLKTEQIDFLRALGNRTVEPRLPKFGLCQNYHNEFDEHITSNFWYEDMCSDWKHFTGTYSYPIPDPDNPRHSGYQAYRDYHPTNANMWNDDKYGNMRRAFCLHVADWMGGHL